MGRHLTGTVKHDALPCAEMPDQTHPWVAEAERRVRFGVFGLAADAARVEALGFDSVWAPDHPTLGRRDGWLQLAVAASQTSRIRLGTLVSCVYYRHPVVLARQAADVDAISQGRLVLGVGIGDVPEEFAHLGLPYPPARERQAALDEAIRIAAPLLAGETVCLDGAHFRADGAKLNGAAVQQPRVPVLIAGGGEKTTLRQVAQYADMSNFGPGNVIGNAWGADDVRRKYELLRGYLDEVGRPHDSVLRSYFLRVRIVASGAPTFEPTASGGMRFERLAATPAGIAAHCRALVEAGVRYFIVQGLQDDLEALRVFGEEVLPTFVATA
jgi:alkanesulfonate monooxygenase SsuD/methylene tetrahydromethanopterin reductase-like flavin-dependent oxidoreductase (luciferase family)